MEIAVIDTSAKVSSMKFLLARPSSLHDDPTQIIKWGPDGLPKIFRGQAEQVITDEETLISLFDEIVQRECVKA
jgi:hypothetical protein